MFPRYHCKTYLRKQCSLLIYDSIQQQNPSLKMYDADIRSLDEAAKGAHNWAGIRNRFWMVPYNTNLWKGTDMGTGMGQYMISAQPDVSQ